MGLPLDGDLAVAHRFQQGTLGPRGRPVDLVGQDHIGEDRTRLEDEIARGRVIDARTQDVGREQVGSELETPERTIDAGGEGAGQQGLPTPGHILDQDVSLGQQRHDGELDDFGLAQDNRSDVLE